MYSQVFVQPSVYGVLNQYTQLEIRIKRERNPLLSFYDSSLPYIRIYRFLPTIVLPKR